MLSRGCLSKLAKVRISGEGCKLTLAAELVAAFAACACVANADTLTWKGGSSGTFSVASNWTSANAGGAEATVGPQPGDTVVFSAETTLTAESFDIGSAGLTIENAGKLHNHVSFSGSGRIVKRGAGAFWQYGDAGGTFTGGARFDGGCLVLQNRYRPNTSTAGQKYFGTGPIEFTHDISTSKKPYVDLNEWDSGLSNEVVFSGRHTASAQDWGAIYFHQQCSCGPITSAHDFNIYQQFRTAKVNGKVSAPGQTMTVYVYSNEVSPGPIVEFTKEVDTSIVKIGSRLLVLSGISYNPANTLTVSAGTNTISATGYWGGTNIVVDGATSVLNIKGTSGISPCASVRIANGGKLLLEPACRAVVRELVVSGESKPEGVYTSANLSGTIRGSGSIRVLRSKAWTGGATGLWSDGSNWEDGVAPTSGDVLSFGRPVELLHEEVDIGSAGFTIVNSLILTNHVTFTGAGGFVMAGPGGFYQKGDAGGTFTGGVRFEDGTLYLNNRYRLGTSASGEGYKYFGSGEIELVSSGSASPYINYWEWACGITNAVRVTGANTAEGTFFAHQWVGTPAGPITATGDFTIHEQYAVFTHSAPISAHGHTMKVNCKSVVVDMWTPVINLNGPIDASIRKVNPGPLNLGGVSPEPGNTLTLEGGTNTIAAAAVWGGTNVVVSGATTLLRLQGADNLSPLAAVSVSGGAKIEVTNGVRVAVASLSVGGERKPSGIYTAANCPATIAGGGSLRVGMVGMTMLFR